MPEMPARTGKEVERVDRGDIIRRRLEDERQLAIRTWQREMLAPMAAAGGTWTFGECAHLIELAAHSPLTVASATGATAASVVFVTRWGLNKVWSQRWSHRFWAAGATATVWSALASVAGSQWSPGWLMTGTLAASTAGLAGKWWRQRRITTPSEGEPLPKAVVEVVEPTVEPPSGSAFIQERWDRYLAAPGKSFQRSYLTDEKELPTGWQFDVHLDPDKVNAGFDDLLAKREKIAAVMGVAPNDIQLETHPSLDHSKAVLKVLVVNPLKDGIPYTGPRYDEGRIKVGPWRDGTGWGSVRLADHKATVMNGLVSGDPGAGKSVFLENLGMSALFSGKWMVFYCDGSPDGDSSPILSNYMTASTSGLQGAWEQFEAVNEYMTGRGKENAALPEDIRGVNPSEERLGLLWILDELHLLTRADKNFASKLESTVRLGRKKGLAVWGATQGLDLNLDFAGISTLRDILTSRNVVSFYSSSKYAHNLVNGPQIAPYTLPSDGGYAVLRAAGSSKASELRTDYSDDMSPWAKALPTLSLENDEIAQLTVGDYIEKNRRVAGQGLREARLLLDEYKRSLRTGTKRIGQRQSAPTPTVASSAVNSLIDRMPAPLTVGDLRVVAGDVENDPKESKKDAVLAELRKRGEATTGEIAKALSVGLSTVTMTLTRAAQKAGSGIEDRGQGKWAAVPTGTGEGVA